MARKLLSNLFWALMLLCLLILVNSGESEKQQSNPHNSESDSLQPKPRNEKRHQSFYEAFDTVFRIVDSAKRLEAINHALEIARKTDFNGEYELHKLHTSAALIHHDRWHYHYAINSLIAAQEIKFDERIDNRIKRLRKHLSKVEKERNFNSDYIATRGSGPAKQFRGKVLVTYIFIDDGIKTRWSKKTMQRSGQVLNLVQNWQKQQAEKYGVTDLKFQNKIFSIKRNPRLKQLSSVSLKSPKNRIGDYIEAIAQSLGEKNLGDFIQRQLKLENADQAVVIFHSNFNERSFARRCGFTHQKISRVNGIERIEYISRCKEEFVVLMNKVERNRWDKLHYTQAHEILHVFGADDLYNIRGASDYALTDIMNFQSKKLEDSSIHPVTAYAIGWQNKPPKTPFKILDK